MSSVVVLYNALYEFEDTQLLHALLSFFSSLSIWTDWPVSQTSKTNNHLSFASSFTAVANSLVTDILLPLFSCLPGLTHNLDEAFLVLQQSSHSQIAPKPGQKKPYYNTVQQALDDGAIVWAYGNFIDKLLRFVLIALALFTVTRIYGWVTSDNIVKRQIKCKYCRKYISDKAKRCVNCTSWLDGREEPSGQATNSTVET